MSQEGDEEVVFDEVLTRVASLAEDCILPKRGLPTSDASSGLFLGIRAAAEEANILQQHNITTVVSVGTWPERVRAHSFGHNQEVLQRHCAIRLPGSTFNSMRIESCLRLLHKLNQVVEETAENANGGLLVYAHEENEEDEAGATALVVAWLMYHRGIKFGDAFAAVEKLRPSAECFEPWETELLEWQEMACFPEFENPAPVIDKKPKGGDADASTGEASAAAAPAPADAAAEAAAGSEVAADYRSMFAEGDLAVLRALVSKPELNWQKVTVGAWQPEKGRFKVKLAESAPLAPCPRHTPR